MKINRNLFKNKDYKIEETIDFSNVSFSGSHIKKIGLSNVVVTGFDYDDYLILNIKICTLVLMP